MNMPSQAQSIVEELVAISNSIPDTPIFDELGNQVLGIDEIGSWLIQLRIIDSQTGSQKFRFIHCSKLDLTFG